MLCKEVNCVVDLAHLVNKVIRYLAEVAKCVHVVVTSFSKLVLTQIARVGDWVDSGEYILS